MISAAGRRSAARALVPLLATVAVACSDQPRLVLLYMPCTVNTSFLSPYDPSVPYTPNFARLADQGVVFQRHQTEAGQSGVAYASIFSGTQASRHGVFRHPTKIGTDVLLIGEAFERAGFETWFWADHPMASPDLDFGRGVAPERTKWTPRAPFSANAEERFLMGDDADFRELLQSLVEQPAKRAFVMTNFTVTHGAYDANSIPPFCNAYPKQCEALSPAAWKRYLHLYATDPIGWSYDFRRTVRKHGLSDLEIERFVTAVELLYAANIYRLDALLGDVLDAIDESGLRDDSLIAVTADHGEAMYRPNAATVFTHGFTLAPEVLHVPWLLSVPGLSPMRYAGVTRSVDVLPTLAGLAAVPLDGESVDGVDLSAVLRERRPSPDLLAYSHTALYPGLPPGRKTRGREVPGLTQPEMMSVAIRDGDRVYKLIPDADGERVSAYDWSEDPLERRDLYDPSDPIDREFEARMKAYKDDLVAAFHRRANESPDELPLDEQERRLRSLGYIE